MITAHTIMNQRWAFCQKVLGGSAVAAGANGAGLVGADGAKGAGLVGSDTVVIPPVFAHKHKRLHGRAPPKEP
jgi:hypothetical protein